MTDTLGPEQVVAFVDYQNTQAALRLAGRRIDLDALRAPAPATRSPLLPAGRRTAQHPTARRHDACDRRYAWVQRGREGRHRRPL
jgi:hypothetical protein